jgi:hypothetical protein
VSDNETAAMDVLEACADALLTSAALCLLLEDPSIRAVDINEARDLAVKMLNQIIGQTIAEGPRPRLGEIPQPMCFGCGKRPEEIREFIRAGEEADLTPTEYVLAQEGTLNRRNGHFMCTECWVRSGKPSTSGGWVAP